MTNKDVKIEDDANNDNENHGKEEAEEIVSEEDENTSKLISNLREKLKECEKEKQEYLNGWQRTRADFINYKKREEEEKKEFLKFAGEKIIVEMIPVLESFEMAFSNREIWESLPVDWRKGVEYIHSQLIGVLKSNGLEELNPGKGEKFDPNVHIAESSQSTFDKKEDDVIMKTLKKGYGLNGKIITEPRVIVAEYREKEKSTSESN